MERFSYHCRMTSPDLSSILDDLAAGRIDTAEANRRISALKTDTGSESGSGSRQEEAPKGKPGGLTRVAITAVGRRVRIEGDPSVSNLSVEGPHQGKAAGPHAGCQSRRGRRRGLIGSGHVRPPATCPTRGGRACARIGRCFRSAFRSVVSPRAGGCRRIFRKTAVRSTPAGRLDPAAVFASALRLADRGREQCRGAIWASYRCAGRFCLPIVRLSSGFRLGTPRARRGARFTP